MAQRKSPPPYTWIAAPIGWWFKGPYGRKLAHVWQGSDKLTHAFIFVNDEQIERGPFLTEEAAMSAIADELHPQAKTA